MGSAKSSSSVSLPCDAIAGVSLPIIASKDPTAPVPDVICDTGALEAITERPGAAVPDSGGDNERAWLLVLTPKESLGVSVRPIIDLQSFDCIDIYILSPYLACP